jgi:hypothetical protein
MNRIVDFQAGLQKQVEVSMAHLHLIIKLNGWNNFQIAGEF